MGWKDKRAHRKAECWKKPVHEMVTPSHVRICPHGVAYTMWNVGVFEPRREWHEIDEFFIRAGNYDW